MQHKHNVRKHTGRGEGRKRGSLYENLMMTQIREIIVEADDDKRYVYEKAYHDLLYILPY